MTTEPDRIIHYRLQRAVETLSEARLLAANAHWNACVNRLYYACFYAASALLLRHSLAAVKHSGVLGLFNRHFVKPGLVERDLGELYNHLFRKRHQADYEDLVSFDAEEVRPMIDQTGRLIERIEEILGAPAGDPPKA